MNEDNPFTPLQKGFNPMSQSVETGSYIYPREEDKIIHRMIEIHRSELEKVGEQLAREGKRKTILASTVKATVIFLGALVAIKEVANQLLGASNITNILVFTIAGLLIATLTGLETAFKWGDTSTELKNLAAESRAASRKAASSLAKTFAAKQGKERTKELQQILDTLDEKAIDVQKRAAKIGIETVSLNNMYRVKKVEISHGIDVEGG